MHVQIKVQKVSLWQRGRWSADARGWRSCSTALCARTGAALPQSAIHKCAPAVGTARSKFARETEQLFPCFRALLGVLASSTTRTPSTVPIGPCRIPCSFEDWKCTMLSRARSAAVRSSRLCFVGATLRLPKTATVAWNATCAMCAGHIWLQWQGRAAAAGSGLCRRRCRQPAAHSGSRRRRCIRPAGHANIVQP